MMQNMCSFVCLDSSHNMSSIIKKKLAEALKMSQNIDKEQRSVEDIKKLEPSRLSVSNLEDVDVGDENGVYTIALNHDGSQAAVGLGSGLLQVYDGCSWERLRKLRTGSLYNLPLLAVKFYPCLTMNALFTAGSDGVIKAWNLETYTHGQSVEEPGNQIMSLDFSNDGAFFVTGGKDSSVRVYDSSLLRLCKLYRGSNQLNLDSKEESSIVQGHSQKVFCVKFHPDNSFIFLSASWDHTLKVWDRRLDNAVRTIHGPYVCGDGLDISHNKILTASWSAQEALQLYDFSSGRLMHTFDFPTEERHGEYLYCARFWDDRHVVAGGSGTNDLKILDAYSNTVVDDISGLSHPVQCVEVLEKRGVLVCGTSRNVLRRANLLSRSDTIC